VGEDTYSHEPKGSPGTASLQLCKRPPSGDSVRASLVKVGQFAILLLELRDHPGILKSDIEQVDPLVWS
jgi:hypothetical protein